MIAWLVKILGLSTMAEVEVREAAVSKREQELEELEDTLDARDEEIEREYEELEEGRKWRLVFSYPDPVEQTIDVPGKGKYDSDTKKKIQGKLYYHFYEDKDGHRRMEYGCTLDGLQNSDLSTTVTKFDYYHTVVLPWLGNRSVDGIPSYLGAEMLDVQNKLSQ